MTMSWEEADGYMKRAVDLAIAAERWRIGSALAAIHRPYFARQSPIQIIKCHECKRPVDLDGDCPTMRIVKGKD